MEKINVHIVTLPPMRVACVNGFGPSPELAAQEKMRTWAASRKLLETPFRLFGYNNPAPSAGSPNYGYDVWISVDQALEPDDQVRIIDFPGGMYAVTRVEAAPNGDGIFEAWQALARWVEQSQYTAEYDRRECLEESVYPFQSIEKGFTLDLFEPIS